MSFTLLVAHTTDGLDQPNSKNQARKCYQAQFSAELPSMQLRINRGFEHRFGLNAKKRLNRRSVFEEDQRRDCPNAEFRRLAIVVIYIDLRNRQAFAIIGSEVLQFRCDRMARSTSVCPEVHQHQTAGAIDGLIKGLISDMDWLIHNSCRHVSYSFSRLQVFPFLISLTV